jgi:hypothetical protein
VRADIDVVATLKTWWPDWWGRGRHTAATARPRIDIDLWPVHHTD